MENRVVEAGPPRPVAGRCFFNLADLILEGYYPDEITAYRARRRWREVLEISFLLENSIDFFLVVNLDEGTGCYRLRSFFHTACGRYAFWRLTHHQAPEAQYIIETAHIPLSTKMFDEIAGTPDMAPLPTTGTLVEVGKEGLSSMKSRAGILFSLLDGCSAAIKALTGFNSSATKDFGRSTLEGRRERVPELPAPFVEYDFRGESPSAQHDPLPEAGNIQELQSLTADVVADSKDMGK